MFKILSSYISFKEIYKMQHLEGSGTPVLYIPELTFKVNSGLKPNLPCSQTTLLDELASLRARNQSNCSVVYCNNLNVRQIGCGVGG